MHENRFYRIWSGTEGLTSFKVKVFQTDLFASADKNLTAETNIIIKSLRSDIEKYIKTRPEFESSLTPLEYDKNAPLIIRDMFKAGKAAGVGPMAAVAGAIAEHTGRGLSVYTEEIIVENGGDIYIKSKHPKKVCIYAGTSPLSGKVGIEISAADTPCGICTSSATVGPSISFGGADAAVVYSRSCALADAAATAVCNRVKSKEGIKPAIEMTKKIQGVEGVLIIIKDAMGAWGKIKIIDI